MGIIPCTNSISWTSHGESRLQQRIKLSKDEITQLIDEDCFIELKEEKKKSHLLMYSYTNRFPFILIIDFKCMEIVTLLPIDYYQNLNFIIPIKLLAEIKEKTNIFLVKGNILSKDNETRIFEKFIEKYRVSAYFTSQDGSKVQCRKIEKFFKYKFGFKIENLISSPSFANSFLLRIKNINYEFDQKESTFGMRLNTVLVADKKENYIYRPQEFIFYNKIQKINDIHLSKISEIDLKN